MRDTMNCSSNPKSHTMPVPDKKRRQLTGAQGNRPTAPKPRVLLGQAMNPSCSDGFYENAMVRRAVHLEGKPLMTVSKIGIDDLKEFSGDMYGDINYKKALPKPESTPRMSKVRKSKSEEIVDAKKESGSCEGEVTKPPPYYTDIDESQIRECIAPILLTPPQTDELSEMIYEPPSHLIKPPVSPVKRSASFNIDRRETNRNPPNTYYQVEDPYLQPKSKISFKSADQNYQIEDPYLQPKSKISYKSADQNYQIEDPYLQPKSKISYKSADPYIQFEDAYLQLKKTPAKPKWRMLGGLGKKGQKIKGSSSEQNLSTK